MLDEAIKELLKYWIVAELNHSDTIKEFIVKNIENNSNNICLKIFDNALSKESITRLYRNHEI